jgi:transcriptional regulator with XRE-family HTH domain
MRSDFFPRVGEAIRAERHRQGLTQTELAARVGRATSRISELERDLKTSRLGKDRLTLLADICDALNLIPVLIPRDQAQRGAEAAASLLHGQAPGPRTSVFDELFVDLGEESAEEEDHSG